MDYLFICDVLDSDIELLNIIKSWLDPDTDLPDESINQIVEYFLYILAFSMDGYNKQEKALVFVGKLSRNGKSTFSDLLKNTFKTYVAQLSPTYLTIHDKSSSAAQPELLRCKGCRFVEIPEVDSDGIDNKIKNSKFKTFTGNDTLSVRDLYKSSNDIVEFVPQSTSIIYTNRDLNFQTEENAVANRLIFFNFPNWFANQESLYWDPNTRNHKLINYNLKSNINSGYYSQSFFNILLKVRIKYTDNNGNKIKLNPPNYFTKIQIENLQAVDSIRSWTNVNLVKSNSRFSINNDYDKWIINTYPKLNNQIRLIPVDYIYNRYCQDNPDDNIQLSVFSKRLHDIYPELYKKKFRSTLFGGKKRSCIPNLYIISNYDNNDDDDDEVQSSSRLDYNNDEM